MPSHSEVIIAQVQQDLQALLSYVTSPAAQGQSASTVERTRFRRLLALGATLLRRFFLSRAAVRPAAPTGPAGVPLGYHDRRPTPYFSILGKLSCERAACTAADQPLVCPLDAERSLPARCSSDLLREGNGRPLAPAMAATVRPRRCWRASWGGRCVSRRWRPAWRRLPGTGRRLMSSPLSPAHLRRRPRSWSPQPMGWERGAADPAAHGASNHPPGPGPAARYQASGHRDRRLCACSLPAYPRQGVGGAHAGRSGPTRTRRRPRAPRRWARKCGPRWLARKRRGAAWPRG